MLTTSAVGKIAPYRTSFYLCVLCALSGQINQRLKNQIGPFLSLGDVPQWLRGQGPRSTLVETPLQIRLFFAKQSQCQNR